MSNESTPEKRSTHNVTLTHTEEENFEVALQLPEELDPDTTELIHRLFRRAATDVFNCMKESHTLCTPEFDFSASGDAKATFGAWATERQYVARQIAWDFNYSSQQSGAHVLAHLE